MVIDSSALLAIAFQEHEALRMARAISDAPVRRISAVNWLEALAVAESRHDADSSDAVQLLMRELDIEAMAFDLEQMNEARRAWRRFGKGRHPAGVNLEDCCAYAAAVTIGEPLLFKGDDFTRTDVAVAEW